MIKYTGVNHLAMVTQDMDMTIRFWRDLLRMRLVAGLGRPGNRHYFFEISENDLIAFFEWPDVGKIPEKDHGLAVKGPIVFDHVSIGVDSDDDLWIIKDRLEANKIWVSEMVNHGFIHSIYAFDPNNIPIEFSAPVSGVDIRRSPKMIDIQPSAVTQEGSEPQSGHWDETQYPTPLNDRNIHPGAGMALAEDDDQKTKGDTDKKYKPV